MLPPLDVVIRRDTFMPSGLNSLPRQVKLKSRRMEGRNLFSTIWKDSLTPPIKSGGVSCHTRALECVDGCVVLRFFPQKGLLVV